MLTSKTSTLAVFYFQTLLSTYTTASSSSLLLLMYRFLGLAYFTCTCLTDLF